MNEGVITPQALEAALALSASSGKRLGHVLVQGGAVTEERLTRILARQLGVPFVDLSAYSPQRDLVKLLPEAAARRHRAVVLERQGEGFLVGLADPIDVAAMDEVERILRRPVAIAACPESQLLEALDRIYRRTDEISGHARALQREMAETPAGGPAASDGKDDAPVARLLQSIFEDAVQVRASDIHIEPQEQALQIRFRIDGVLQQQAQSSAAIAGALTQRLKLMAGLDIAERRMPLDGRFTVTARDREIDVRMATLPGQHGESIVLRLLDRSGKAPGLEGIGMPPAMVQRLRAILRGGSGMLLATGPTGAGKSTTLYAALSEIDVVARKVVTVEDPVEYRFPGIVQVQVNDKIDLTFSRVLRATLRQDPDVVLVGEMRDAETVDIGLRAALTGHLVLSTLHTRDAPSATVRLLDMGAELYMVSSCLRAVVAQRLSRLNCRSCSRPHVPTAQERAWLTLVAGAEGAAIPTQAGPGCSHCGGTGYHGRTGVYEMLAMDESLIGIAIAKGTEALLAASRESMRGHTLADHALALVKDGRTSVGEAMRVVSAGED
ncbi:MAG TPA: GspE/PulE family protein [Usitatibacter sp.]|nr:GspE/PulE family protein [Usitatibacter sp.]